MKYLLKTYYERLSLAKLPSTQRRANYSGLRKFNS